ncbi:MAG: class I SAM-dependent methyltransferase [Chloroflexota bacterium]
MSTIEITRYDTGLGTTYERYALNRLLGRLAQELDIHTVLEGPSDGMTGIAGLNSMVLARQGAQVCVVLPDQEMSQLAERAWDAANCRSRGTFVVSPEPALQFADNSFDLVWSFNVISRLDNSDQILDEMLRVSRRYVLLFVPNRWNYGFWLHRLHHWVSGEPWDHGSVDMLTPKPWQRLLQKRGLKVHDPMWVDIPWWPDIVDAGQLIQDFLPFLKRFAEKARPENRYSWDAENLPYFEPARYPEVHARLERLSFIENSRLPVVRQLFAHHVGILAEKI